MEGEELGVEVDPLRVSEAIIPGRRREHHPRNNKPHSACTVLHGEPEERLGRLRRQATIWVLPAPRRALYLYTNAL